VHRLLLDPGRSQRPVTGPQTPCEVGAQLEQWLAFSHRDVVRGVIVDPKTKVGENADRWTILTCDRPDQPGGWERREQVVKMRPAASGAISVA
jgi:hypothetical protein